MYPLFGARRNQYDITNAVVFGADAGLEEPEAFDGKLALDSPPRPGDRS